MEKFVLTVLRDNVLDSCEVFEDQSLALISANYFCEMANIEVDKNPTYDERMKGWLISDSYGYFVSVVRRQAHHTSYMIGSSYGTFVDNLAGRGFARRGGGYGAIPDWQRNFIPPMRIVDEYDSFMFKHGAPPPPPLPELKPIVAPVPGPAYAPVYAPGDDPTSRKLPGGFTITESKPLTMQEVYDFPSRVRFNYQLEENQKWALVLARTKHRPNQVIVIPGLGCWSQHHMLEELTNKTPLGLKMRDQELLEIQALYDDAVQFTDEEESSSSSSESEEDDLD